MNLIERRDEGRGVSKYFVVSEEELDALAKAAWRDAMSYWNIAMSIPYHEQERVEAEAACRARPVPEVVANKIGSGLLDKLLAVASTAKDVFHGNKGIYALEGVLAALEEKG